MYVCVRYIFIYRKYFKFLLPYSQKVMKGLTFTIFMNTAVAIYIFIENFIEFYTLPYKKEGYIMLL